MNNNQATKEMYEISEPINSLEHFPSLSEVSNKLRKTPRVAEIIQSSRFNINEFNERIPRREKIHVCKSIKEGGNCSYGKRCNSAHFLDELVTKDCGFKDKCRKVKIFKNKLTNNDNEDICNFIHPSEDVDMYLQRIGINKESIKRPEKNPEDSYCTKMCNSFFDKKECENEECKYAHSTEQLKVSPCHFKEKCYLVIKNLDGEYIQAEGCKKLCYFLHEGENMENYETRVVNNMKKPQPRDPQPRKKFDKVNENIISNLRVLKNRSTNDSTNDSENPVVLNVPVESAVDMLQALLKSGTKNVQLNTY